MNLVLIVAVTAIFLIATGMLWHMRPTGDVWLVVSIYLGIALGVVFFQLITRN